MTTTAVAPRPLINALKQLQRVLSDRPDIGQKGGRVGRSDPITTHQRTGPLPWLPGPKLDTRANVGLAFISVAYGVVLTVVFPPPGAFSHMGWASRLHLGLAAIMLAISWAGYYANRQLYPVWRVQFFNIPLIQYMISFGILFAYWQLGATVPLPNGRVTTPNPKAEALIILLVFGAYLLWDVLEIRVQENPRYIEVASTDHDAAPLRPPFRNEFCPRHNPYERGRGGLPKWLRRPLDVWWKILPRDRERAARNLRGGAFISFVFCCVYGIALGLVWGLDLRGTDAVVILDSIYIVSLFAYRYLQWFWPRYWFPSTGEERHPDHS
jgi:hypothetical protein